MSLSPFTKIVPCAAVIMKTSYIALLCVALAVSSAYAAPTCASSAGFSGLCKSITIGSTVVEGVESAFIPRLFRKHVLDIAGR